MLLINKKNGSSNDFPVELAERLIKKGTHSAVNPNEALTLNVEAPLPLPEVDEYKKAVCHSDGCKCTEVVAVEPKEVEPEVITQVDEPEKKEDVKPKGKGGRPRK